MTGLDINLSAQSPDAEPNKAEASEGDKVGENAIPRERPEQKIQQKESVVGTTKDKLEATKIEVGGFATPQKTETQPVVPKTPEEEDPGTSKSAMDKISDGMQKMFAMVEKFMKQIQSMGSATLRGMASTLAMLGFKPAEKWLNEMAGADYAELTSTLKKGNLKIAAISPDDPEAKAKGEAAERGQAQLADRFKSLAQTRGPAFTREMYYSEVVAAWKKKSGNVSKTEITHNDLLDMAVTAQELPATLPGQVAQGPEFVPPLESVTTTINVLGSAPVKVLVHKQAVALQVLPTGEWNIAVGTGAPVRYRMVPGNNVNVPTWLLKSVTLSADGLRFEGKATYSDSSIVEYPSPKLVAMTDVRSFLEKVADNPNGAQHSGTEFRFERIPV